ncbi:MAG: DUF86 domain-containing protein [Candidatus Kerfeldbacteria bacterium]|nr:DUF86 domain-containing protein [Candidatus Kerfeldbacteria bacterium]
MIQLAPLNRDKLRSLIADIESSRQELTHLLTQPKDVFVNDRKLYAQLEHYFRRALEGILTAGTHILSRLPLEAKDYAAIIQSLGTAGIIPVEFAKHNLGLAGYRNRLVHIYWEVSPAELYDTTKEHVNDIGAFAEYFQIVLQYPERFKLTVE